MPGRYVLRLSTQGYSLLLLSATLLHSDAVRSTPSDLQHFKAEFLQGGRTGSGDLEPAGALCSHILSIWEKQRAKKLPFVTLSYAQTFDGMIACKTSSISPTAQNSSIFEEGDRHEMSSNLRISCNESMIMTHALRSIHDAVIIGGRTLCIDNPQLNNRLFHPVGFRNGLKQPIGVVLDTNLTYMQKMLRSSRDETPRLRIRNLIICCSHVSARRFRGLPKRLGNGSGNNMVRLLGCKTNADGRLDLYDVLLSLKNKCKIKSVMVEGGAHILSSFLETAAKPPIIDICAITISPKIIGTISGVGAFSNFNSSNVNKQILPSLDFQSPMTLLIKSGADLLIVSPLQLGS